MQADSRGADAPQPRLSRRGLLVLTAVGGAALAGALVTPLAGGTAGPGTASAGPYGVEGCRSPADASAVDVEVTAHALAADGSPASALGRPGAGPQVGASVRDLAGYAAQDVAACEVVQVTVHLHDTAADAWVPASLQRQPRPLELSGDDGGRLVAVDSSSWRDSLPAGARGGQLQEQASWLVTLVDPVPGTYRLTGRVTADDAASSSGDVEVLLDVVTRAG